MPERVRLRRTKGWRMPENTVIVARPSRWGNWFVIKTAREWRPNPKYQLVDPDALVVLTVNRHGHTDGNHWAGFADIVEARAFAVDLYRRHLLGTYLDIDGPLHRDWYLSELRGKNLGCWCPLDHPCHADVLLDLANQRQTT